MLAGGDASEDEEELALVVGSLKEVVLGGGSEQAKPDAGAKDAATDMGEQAASHEGITRDQSSLFILYIDDCAFWRLIIMYRGVGPYFCMNMVVCRPLYLC